MAGDSRIGSWGAISGAKTAIATMSSSIAVAIEVTGPAKKMARSRVASDGPAGGGPGFESGWGCSFRDVERSPNERDEDDM